jgi:hypothetical protein
MFSPSADLFGHFEDKHAVFHIHDLAFFVEQRLTVVQMSTTAMVADRYREFVTINDQDILLRKVNDAKAT